MLEDKLSYNGPKQAYYYFTVTYVSRKSYCILRSRWDGMNRPPPSHYLDRSARWPTHKQFDRLKTCLAYEKIAETLLWKRDNSPANVTIVERKHIATTEWLHACIDGKRPLIPSCAFAHSLCYSCGLGHCSRLLCSATPPSTSTAKSSAITVSLILCDTFNIKGPFQATRNPPRQTPANGPDILVFQIQRWSIFSILSQGIAALVGSHTNGAILLKK